MERLRCVVERITYHNEQNCYEETLPASILGEKKALYVAVRNDKTLMRNTKLAKRLKDGES